jgi:hypothetical protein
MSDEYTKHQARYAKGMLLVRTFSEYGFKSRPTRILVALKCRWTNREKGYICSPTKFIKFERLLREGWDASYFGELEAPDASR